MEKGILILGDLLEKTCKDMIKTVLSCLEDATKGTIYRVGPIPELQVVRVTSGIRKEGGDEIEWGLPAESDYNYPGKNWEHYRDRPDHVLEAMGWCVEKQISWTADNPFDDVRSVRKQLRGEIEDFYHMEPVLVKKRDVWGGCGVVPEYPKDWWGHPIWQDSDYIVAAVIKIHFLPYTLRRDDRSTKVIKELSRSFGTELLSLHLRERLYRSQKEFARQRLESCKVLAHELRNALIKFGFIFSALNAQMASLREEWEGQLRRAFPDLEWKGSVLDRLSELVRIHMPAVNGGGELLRTCKALLMEQQEMATSPLLPNQGEQWLQNKIRPKWERLLSQSHAWDNDRNEIDGLFERLKKAIHLGVDERLRQGALHLPKDLIEKWVKLAYTYFTPDRVGVLDEVLELLDHPALPIPHRHNMRKTVRSLKVLAEVVPEVEARANRIILSLRYGEQAVEDSGTESDPSYFCLYPYPLDESAEISFVD